MPKDKFLKKEKFSIRKFKVGASSVLISSLLFANGMVVAAEQNVGEASGTEQVLSSSQEVIGEDNGSTIVEGTDDISANEEEIFGVQTAELESFSEDNSSENDEQMVLFAKMSQSDRYPGEKVQALMDASNPNDKSDWGNVLNLYEQNKEVLLTRVKSNIAWNNEKGTEYSGENGFYSQDAATWKEVENNISEGAYHISGIHAIIKEQRDLDNYVTITGNNLTSDTLVFANTEPVVFPAGTYTIPSTTQWYLAPGFGGDIDLAGATFILNKTTGADGGLYVYFDGDQAGRTVKGGAFKGKTELPLNIISADGKSVNNTGKTTSSLNIVSVKGANLTFDSLSFDDVHGYNGHVFDLLGVDNVTISNSTFSNYLGNASTADIYNVLKTKAANSTDEGYLSDLDHVLFTEPIQIDTAYAGGLGFTETNLAKEIQARGGLYGISYLLMNLAEFDKTPSSNVTISRNKFINTPGIGAHSTATNGKDFTNLTITENTFENTVFHKPFVNYNHVNYAPVHLMFQERVAYDGDTADVKQQKLEAKMKELGWNIGGNTFIGVENNNYGYESGTISDYHARLVGFYASVEGVSEPVTIPFATKYVRDDNREVSYPNIEVVLKEGETGSITYKTVDGVKTDIVVESLSKQPVDRVISVGTKTQVEKDVVIPFTREADEENPDLPAGERQLKQAGVDGLKTVTTTYNLDEKTGKVTANDPTEEVVTQEMVPEIWYVGTRVDDTRVVDVPFTKIYIEDSTLAYPERRIDVHGVIGKISRTIQNGIEIPELDKYLVEKVDEVIRVGIKPSVTTEPIAFVTTYVANPEVEAGLKNVQTPDVNGVNGVKEVTTTYTLNTATGIVTANKPTEKVKTQPVAEVISVGTKPKVTTTDIDFETAYIYDETLTENEEKVIQEGQKGQTQTTTTYSLNADGTVTENQPTTVTVKKLVTKIIATGKIEEVPDYAPEAEPLPEAEVKTDVIPYGTQVIENASLVAGQRQIVREGVNGSRTYAVTPEGEFDLEVIPAVDEIIHVGTKTAGSDLVTGQPQATGLSGAGQMAEQTVAKTPIQLATATTPTYSRVARQAQTTTEKALPNTGDSGSLLGLVGLTMTSLAGLGLRRHQK